MAVVPATGANIDAITRALREARTLERESALVSPIGSRKTAAARQAEDEHIFYTAAIARQHERIAGLQAAIKDAEAGRALSDDDASRARMAAVAAGKQLVSASRRVRAPERVGLDDSALDVQLGTLATLSGLSISASTNVLLEPRDGQRQRRYSIAGSSFQIPFSIEFDVDEHALAIMRLAVQVPETMQDALGPLCERAAATRSVRLFFRTFVDFARAHKARRLVLRKMKTEFAALVALPQGAFASAGALLSSPEAEPILQFQLSWRLETAAASGALQETIELLPLLARDVVAADEAGDSAQFPAQFRALVESFGVEIALRMLLQTLQGLGQPARR